MATIESNEAVSVEGLTRESVKELVDNVIAKSQSILQEKEVAALDVQKPCKEEEISTNGQEMKTDENLVSKTPSVKSADKYKVLGVEFAPVNLPFERRLQTLAVLQWWLTVTVLPIISVCVFLYMLFYTRFWFVPIIYVSWIAIYDKKTPKSGGRRSNFVRGLAVWNYYRDYFPISLIKTADLEPQANYIFGYHPHGIIGCGAFCNFATEANGFSKLFPGIKPYLLTLNVQFFWPFLRAYIMSCGLCDVSRESINWVLTENGKGNAAVIVIGGAEEALDARPNIHRLTLKNRKGFCKMALKTGSHLVPCFSFGENELFNQAENPVGSKTRIFQDVFKKIFSYSPPFVYGRGVFNYNFGLMPFRRPVTTVVGKPITVPKVDNPTVEEIDELHSAYVSALSNLFDHHKKKYIGADTEAKLEFI